MLNDHTEGELEPSNASVLVWSACPALAAKQLPSQISCKSLTFKRPGGASCLSGSKRGCIV